MQKKRNIYKLCTLCGRKNSFKRNEQKKTLYVFIVTLFFSLKYEYEQDTIAQEEKLHFSFFCNEIFTYINNNQA